MKFNFEFNKKETPEYNRSESADRSEDVIPAQPELENQSLEDTFNKDNEGKDSRNAFVAPEDIADEHHDWETYGEKTSPLPIPDQGRGYETSAEADPGVRERIQTKIKELIEENPENFHDQFVHLIAHLPLSEVDRVLEGIEKEKLVTMIENVVLDNEGNKIDVSGPDDEVEDMDPRTALRSGIKIKGMPRAYTDEETRDSLSKEYKAWKAAPSRLNFKTESDSKTERRNRGLLGDLMQNQTFEDPNMHEGRYDDEAETQEREAARVAEMKAEQEREDHEDLADWVQNRKNPGDTLQDYDEAA